MNTSPFMFTHFFINQITSKTIIVTLKIVYEYSFLLY